MSGFPRGSTVCAGALLLANISSAHDLRPGEAPDVTPKAEILLPEEGEKLLMPDDRFVILKTTRERNGAQSIMLGTEALPPGTAIPVHSHDGYEEVIFIHEGTVQMTLGEEVVEVPAGTTMFVPPGTWHGVSAAGEEAATMLFIFPEPDVAGFFREVGHPEGESPKVLTPEDWGRIMQQHQMRARRP